MSVDREAERAANVAIVDRYVCVSAHKMPEASESQLNLLSGRPYCLTTLQASSPSFVVATMQWTRNSLLFPLIVMGVHYDLCTIYAAFVCQGHRVGNRARIPAQVKHCSGHCHQA